MTYRSLLKLLRAVVVALCALVGARARADVAPPDACNVPGSACGLSGTCSCATTTCTRVIPCSRCQPGQCEEDGGATGDDSGPNAARCHYKYPCGRCRTSDGSTCDNNRGLGGSGGRSGSSGGGAGGAGGASGSGAAGKDAGAQGTDQDMEDDGCACSSLDHRHDLPNAWLFAAAFTGLYLRRRWSASR